MKFSLLEPADLIKTPEFTLSENDWEELGLSNLQRNFETYGAKGSLVKKIFTYIQTDEKVITYRMDLLRDLLAQDELVQSFSTVLGEIESLSESLHYKSSDHESLLQILWRFRELELYVKCVKSFRVLLESQSSSECLNKLKGMIEGISQSEEFIALSRDIQAVKLGLEKMGSITIGLNLNSQLEPVQATLLSVNEERFPDGSSMVSKILSFYGYSGKSTMHTNPDVLPDKSHLNRELNGLRQIMFRDLSQVVKKVVRPVGDLLRGYIGVNAEWLLQIKDEIAYYLAAVQFIKKMQSMDLPMSRPQLLPISERKSYLYELYNPLIALQKNRASESSPVVTNDVSFDNEGRILLVTGPNSGGKTVYTQAIGLIHIMAQIGLFVPCHKAEISPVDQVFSQLQVRENALAKSGKLGIESEEIQGMFKKATRNSLVLLNETFSSTSPGESLYLMKDIVLAFRILGIRGVFTTHLHELANHTGQLNSLVKGDSQVVSMVAGIISHSDEAYAYKERSYKIVPGSPRGTSYAKDIAVKHGISLEQIQQLLVERQVAGNEQELIIS